MPRYTYKCSECGVILEAMHSISERLLDCENCGSASLKKIPPRIQVASKMTAVPKKPGSVVRDHIRDAKESIKREKEEMRKELE
tara:strand:+ start:348 stop:599 length:252 start_codon:yes stop_codon:yes gene_type:complete